MGETERNGQVSIPAEARARWNARKVVVVDMGDRIVMRDLLGVCRAEGIAHLPLVDSRGI